MSRTDSLVLTAIRESTPGVTPTISAGDTWKFYCLSETLEDAIGKSADQQIRGDRLTQGFEQDAHDVAGGFKAYFSYGLARKWLDAGFMKAASDLPWRAGSSQITGVTAADDTYAVTTGGAFAPGQLVRASGFTNSANNGVFKAQAGSDADSVVAPDGTVNETPPATARLEVVGFEGASGDLTLSASSVDADGDTVATLGSTALDFTTLGILYPGQRIKIGEDLPAATGNRFATAAVNAFVRVKSVAANAVVITSLPAGWAADAGTGKTIRVWCGHFYTIGTTYFGTTVFVNNSGQASQRWLALKGCMPDQWDITVPFRARAEFNITKMFGLVHELLASAPDAGPQPPVNTEITMGGAHVTRAGILGDFKTFGNCRSLSMKANNNMEGIECIEGSLAPLAYAGGFGRSAEYSAEGTHYFADHTTVNAYREDAPMDVYCVTKRKRPGQTYGYAFSFDFNRAIITKASRTVAGKNQGWYVDFEAQAIAHPSTGVQASATLFPYTN